MRAVLQRVTEATVRVDGVVVGQIGLGWLVLLGVAKGDTDDDVKQLAAKVVGLRAFSDLDGKMNRSVVDVGGSILVVSQFTLLGNCRGGKRPSFSEAAPPEQAERLYLGFATQVESLGVIVAKGVFRADMKVSLVNDGPVTLLLDSRKLF